MVVEVTLLVVTLSITLGDIVTSQNVRVDFTTNPANNFVEGSQVLLSCNVSGSFNDETDTLAVLKASGKSTRLVSEEGKDPAASENVQFVGWVPIPGADAFVLYLNIFNITRADRGNYTCNALRQTSSRNFKILAQQTVVVDIMFLPSGKPACTATPPNPNFTWYDGDEITLQCTSDAGNPPVPLEWKHTANSLSIPNPDAQVSTDRVVSVLQFKLNTDFNGVTFSCIRQNSSISTKQTCVIGPFTVLNATDLQTGAIAAIIMVVSVIAIIIVIILFCLFKSGRFKLGMKMHGPTSHVSDNDTLDVTHGNGTVAATGCDNPVNVKHVLSPNGGEEYAVIQKDKFKNEAISSGNNNKIYPDPPAYPRPAQSQECVDGQQYANTNTVGEKHNEGIQDSSIPEEAKSLESPKRGNVKDKYEMTVYANTLDIGGVSQSAKPTDTPAKSADAIAGASHLPAPTESPPPPPNDSNITPTSMSHTQELE